MQGASTCYSCLAQARPDLSHSMRGNVETVATLLAYGADPMNNPRGHASPRELAYLGRYPATEALLRRWEREG